MINIQSHIAKIRLSTAFASLLISIVAFYGNDLLNRDGILYVDMASAYVQGGFDALLQYSDFGWPFFSIVIAYIHQITHLPVELSAIALNVLLFVVLTDALVLVSNKILPNPRQVAFAALLFLCFFTLNHYRVFIGRDVGYWAFCMLALYQFILYLEKPSIKKALLWQILMVLAILFRIDGVVILLGLPLYLFTTQSPTIALKQIIQFFYLLIAGAVLAMLIAIDQSSLATIFSKIGSITKYINPDNVLTHFKLNTDLIETHILNKFSARYSALILSSGLITMLVYKLINALTLGYLGIYIYSLWKYTFHRVTPYRKLIAYFLALNLIILLGFIFTEYFVSKRYTVLAVMGLLLLMLPRICDTLEKAWLANYKPILVAVGLILFVSLVDSLTHSNSKVYIKDVAIWASNNLPENSRVLTNNKIIKYYFNSHQPLAEISLDPNVNTYQNYDYLIILIEKNKFKELGQQLTSMKIKPIYKLENKRGSKATVYLVQPPQ